MPSAGAGDAAPAGLASSSGLALIVLSVGATTTATTAPTAPALAATVKVLSKPAAPAGPGAQSRPSRPVTPAATSGTPVKTRVNDGFYAAAMQVKTPSGRLGSSQTCPGSSPSARGSPAPASSTSRPTRFDRRRRGGSPTWRGCRSRFRELARQQPGAVDRLRRWALHPDRQLLLEILRLFDPPALGPPEPETAAALRTLVAGLGKEPTLVEAASKVLALLVPHAIPLMPPLAVAYVLGEGVPSDRDAFVAMVSWFGKRSSTGTASRRRPRLTWRCRSTPRRSSTASSGSTRTASSTSRLRSPRPRDGEAGPTPPPAASSAWHARGDVVTLAAGNRTPMGFWSFLRRTPRPEPVDGQPPPTDADGGPAADASVGTASLAPGLARLLSFGDRGGPQEDEALTLLRAVRQPGRGARARHAGPEEPRRPLARDADGRARVGAARPRSRTAARTLLETADGVSALVLRADLLAEDGDLAGAVAIIERALLQDLDLPGARERRLAWRGRLGLSTREASVDPATVTLAAWQAPGRAPFDLVREVARGGAGAVFAARDRELGRTVALGIYHQPERDPAQLLDEGRVAAALEGPGIVRVFDVEPDEGWLVMKWAPLGALADHLRPLRGGAKTDAPAGTALALHPLDAWIPELARALARVHAAGWVHHDVKPSNVLLAREGSRPVPWLADFGSARRTGEPSPPGSMGYVSPERLAGRASDPTDDLYGFCRVLEDVLLATDRRDLAPWREVAAACVGPSGTRPADGAALVLLLGGWTTREVRAPSRFPARLARGIESPAMTTSSRSLRVFETIYQELLARLHGDTSEPSRAFTAQANDSLATLGRWELTPPTPQERSAVIARVLDLHRTAMEDLTVGTAKPPSP